MKAFRLLKQSNITVRRKKAGRISGQPFRFGLKIKIQRYG